ncbi:MAG TPA: glucosaminidase domain-containing protein [Gemmatimonadales bacterium]
MSTTAEQRRAFIESMVTAVRSVPVPVPALRPVAVAQAALESAYGTSGLARNYRNLFGVKARAGQPAVQLDTTEYVKGVAQRVKQPFRVYASFAESIADHADLFRRLPKTYAKALAHPDEPAKFASGLTGVYATDPLYGSKVVKIMKDYQLPQRFGFGALDAGVVVSSAATPSNVAGVAVVAVALAVVGRVLLA